MKTKIEQVVRGLYQNENHRKIFEVIFDNRPTLVDVCSQIDTAAKKYFERQHRSLKHTFEQYPEKSANPQEIKIFPESLEKSGFRIGYILRSKARHPFIGDSFTILILAWCDSAAARRRVRNLSVRLPKRMTHDFKNWASWELIWEGATFELRDLSPIDGRNLSRLLVKTMSETFRPLEMRLFPSSSPLHANILIPKFRPGLDEIAHELEARRVWQQFLIS